MEDAHLMSSPLSEKYINDHGEIGRNQDLTPVMGMKFRCYEDAREFYNRYALGVGFGTKIKSSWPHKKTKESIMVVFVCCRRVLKMKKKNALYRRPTKKTGCGAYMRVKPNRISQKEMQKAMHIYFTRMQQRNSNFFYLMDLDNEGHLRNVFWADARSRAAYGYFGDVVTFDTTYLTNRYDMSFAPFVGVNHHGQSVLLGCGLLADETIESFIWMFKTWLIAMSGHPPNAIITDQCKAMQRAIAVVFPKARHRLCLWHI
ncbi:hypothetical protein HHK36_033340 [Tetracentron sinense]|uniref:Protein FAR1-RELATED SEQUENCE n=1 Tax=Tetracentron sinense TaxID=13715 RepID=A0A834Y578_TETSI|nr:hypothetical protein HHK36_033340 [Tetracentron sinense]